MLVSYAPTCPATALKVSFHVENSPTMSQPSAYFSVINTSATTCKVNGHPAVVLYDAAAGPIFGPATPGDAFEINDPGARDVELPSRETAFFGVGWSDVNQVDGGTLRGCSRAVGAGVTIPGGARPVWVPTNLESPICMGPPTVSAIGLADEFNPTHP